MVKTMKLCHSHWPISHISWIIKNQDSKSCEVQKDEWFKNGIISHKGSRELSANWEIWYFILTRLYMPSSWGKKETKLLIGKLYWNNTKKKRRKEGKRRERGKKEIIRSEMVHKCGSLCVYFSLSFKTQFSHWFISSWRLHVSYISCINRHSLPLVPPGKAKTYID